MKKFETYKKLTSEFQELTEAYNLLREIYLIYMNQYGAENVINNKTVNSDIIERLMDLFEDEE